MLVMLWSRIPKNGSTSLHQRLHSSDNARHIDNTELYSTESIEAVGRAERYVIETYGYRFGEDRQMDIPRLAGIE